MPSQARNGRYHHGDLRAALIGTRNRDHCRAGRARLLRRRSEPAPRRRRERPYAHFADRDGLLAAVAVHAHELFYANWCQG